MQVTSTPGQGSTFSFSVPLAPAPEEDPAFEFVAPDLKDSALLIVAGSEIESSLLARRLGRWGAKTCAVTTNASQQRCCRSAHGTPYWSTARRQRT